MFDLTTIQLRNEMVGSNLGDPNRERLTVREACCPRVVRRASLLFCCKGVIGEEGTAERLDEIIDPGFTEGEWQEWQKRQ